MNVRKSIDYSTMFAALDAAMCAGMSQMKLYCELGRIVCTRSEKGAAVAAAEYLSCHYPDVPGLSPRNLRRMRDFCRLYEREPELVALAMEIGWTQNVVILEADLSMEERRWYLRAVRQFGWTKTELQRKIASAAHLEPQLDEQNVQHNIESAHFARFANWTSSSLLYHSFPQLHFARVQPKLLRFNCTTVFQLQLWASCLGGRMWDLNTKLHWPFQRGSPFVRYLQNNTVIHGN